jgi:hypothetical protein
MNPKNIKDPMLRYPMVLQAKINALGALAKDYFQRALDSQDRISSEHYLYQERLIYAQIRGLQDALNEFKRKFKIKA